MTPDELQSKIDAEIAKADDSHTRVLLLLMQGLYSQMAQGFADLTVKIDTILADEKELKGKVLNGHADEFDANMTWVKERRADSAMAAARRAFFADRLANGGYCKWAADKIRTEQQDAEDAADSRRRIRDAVIEKVLIGAISAMSTAMGMWIFFRA